MNAATIAKYASLLAVGLWSAKAIAIALAGGLGRSPVEDTLFFAGLVSCIVAVGALALAHTAGRSLALRMGAVVAGIVAASALALALGTVVEMVAASDHWVWSELNLWVLAVAVFVLAWLPIRRVARA
ncbi:MAG: hypothetical protein M3Y52_02820 [Actinomycetota bacterium]|nr:hypothetical protein [Actinomycetota bacterium]